MPTLNCSSLIHSIRNRLIGNHWKLIRSMQCDCSIRLADCTIRMISNHRNSSRQNWNRTIGWIRYRNCWITTWTNGCSKASNPKDLLTIRLVNHSMNRCLSYSRRNRYLSLIRCFSTSCYRARCRIGSIGLNRCLPMNRYSTNRNSMIRCSRSHCLMNHYLMQTKMTTNWTIRWS